MKIMVFDVPAVTGGALTVLKEFHTDVIENNSKNVEWIFVVSLPDLTESENVKVLNFKWIKKSWLHRMYFDYIVAPNLIKKFDIDKVFSLQNIVIPRVNIPQVLYVHQSLPFVEYRFSFRDEKLLWVYQNIISKKIYRSIKAATKVIVQTKWMMEVINSKVKTNAIIEVVPPIFHFNIDECFTDDLTSTRIFFYPANAEIYKNHKLIVEACLELKKNNQNNYMVIFTLDGSENTNIKRLFDIVRNEKLPISFIGRLDSNEVFEYYKKSILVFPSFIETYGLPLLEARLHNSPIIAANLEYAKEVLEGYSNAHFVNPMDTIGLAKVMQEFIEDNFVHDPINMKYQNEQKKELVNVVLS